MQRFFVHRTDTGLTLSFNWASFAIESVINIAITMVLLAVANLVYSRAHQTLFASLIYIFPTFFTLNAVGSIALVIFPIAVQLDRRDDVVKRGPFVLGKLSDVEEFRVDFTGYSSPSKYGVFAYTKSNGSYQITDNGYFGSRLEIDQLTEILNEALPQSRSVV